MSKIDIAIIGASTQVGETLVEIIEERKLPVANIHLLDEENIAGGRVEFNQKSIVIKPVETFDFTQVKLAFFVSTEDVSKIYAIKAADKGCVVIDRTPAFRNDKDIPLVVPGINNEHLTQVKGGTIISIPSAITTGVLMAIKPVYDETGIEEINISTYQSVSGEGKNAAEELASQTAGLLNFREIKTSTFDKQIAFNVLPQVGKIDDETGYSVEETKIYSEIKKVLNDQAISIDVHCVRVPVFIGHSANVQVKTKTGFTMTDIRSLISNTEGVELSDASDVATPVTDAAGHDDVYISRLKKHIDDDHKFSFWTVTDNLRKGSSLNMVQVAEQLVDQL